jgi:2-polyprenyl-3-methyl-5-hydroxy-6-metoxy-1,4-benzoquinol methylase
VKAQHIPYVEPNALSAFESRSTYDAVFKGIGKYVPRGAKVLDVGCGRGEILKLLSENGYDAYGCDTDDKCVQMGSFTEKSGNWLWKKCLSPASAPSSIA